MGSLDWLWCLARGGCHHFSPVEPYITGSRPIYPAADLDAMRVGSTGSLAFIGRVWPAADGLVGSLPDNAFLFVSHAVIP